MSEKPKKPAKLRPDVNEVAHRVMLEATGQIPKSLPPGERPDTEKNPDAVARGSKGGKKGGPVRIDSLTDRQRRDLAKKAAKKRWEEAG